MMQVDRCRVSVILPAYNAARTVAQAVASCLEQTMQDLEVIVVDDASHDDTAAQVLVAAACDPRVRLIRLADNGGVSNARNTGIAAAGGTWIAPLDADDRFAPTRLATLIERAEAIGADLVGDNLRVSFADGKLSDRLAFPEARMRQTRRITAGQFAASDRPRWGLPAAGFLKPVIRRSFLEQQALRYRDDLHAGEDFHLYVQCLLRGALLYYVADALYLYTLDERSLSRSDQTRVRNSMVRSSEDLCEEAKAINDSVALTELRARHRDLMLWLGYIELEAALRQRRFGDALRTYARLPSKTYPLVRLAGRLRYAVMVSVGRVPNVHEAVVSETAGLRRAP